MRLNISNRNTLATKNDTKSKSQSLTQNWVILDLCSAFFPGQQAVEAVYICRLYVTLHGQHELVGSGYPIVNFGFIHERCFRELHGGAESLLEVLRSLAVLPLVRKRERCFISYLAHLTDLLTSPWHTRFFHQKRLSSVSRAHVMVRTLRLIWLKSCIYGWNTEVHSSRGRK